MRSISSSEKSQRLQNTVPVAMQTSSEEKPTVTGPSLNSSIESATARKTKVTEMLIRLLREWKNCSQKL